MEPAEEELSLRLSALGLKDGAALTESQKAGAQPSKSAVGLVYDERMTEHCTPYPEPHPEQPARITSIYDRLVRDGLADQCIRVPARPATEEELQSLHSPEHVKLMMSISGEYTQEERNGLAESMDSIYLNEASSSAALLSAGSVIEAAMRVANGELLRCIAVVRPPGHHAEHKAARGFCLYNNVALAAKQILLKQELAIKKILIVDWDVHHGNGIQQMFWEDAAVLYFSVHRYDRGMFYPCSQEGNAEHVGGGKGAGYNVNVPWPGSGFGDADYLSVWHRVLLPIAYEYAPDLVLISAGFDAAEGDPLGRCCLTPVGYAHLTHALLALASGRCILALEGGYNLTSISNSMAACTAVMVGYPVPAWPEDAALSPRTAATINEASCAGRARKILEVLGSASSLYHVVSQALQLADNSTLESWTENKAKDWLADMANNTEPWAAVRAAASTLRKKKIPSGLAKRRSKQAAVREPKELLDSNAALVLDTSTEPSVQPIAVTSGASAALDEEEVEDGVSTAQVMGNQGDALGSPNSRVWELSMLDSTYCWYASYGSNMWQDRFMCYIQGGQVAGMTKPCRGSSDQRPPVAKLTRVIPHQLFFARNTRIWGAGGACFLDPVPSASAATHIVMYKITLRQFNDVFIQENAQATEAPLLDLTALTVLRAMPAHETMHLCKGWYGGLKYLTDESGAPVMTFTCPLADMKLYRDGTLPLNPPSAAYAAAIARGLVHGVGLSTEEATEYVSTRAALQNADLQRLVDQESSARM
eukprot:jgi/Chlat1/4844/Chrsp31S04807